MEQLTLTLILNRLFWVTFVDTVGYVKFTPITGVNISGTTITWLLLFVPPSCVPSFGVKSTVQFWPEVVSFETIRLVLLLNSARICSPDNDLFQIRRSSIDPLKNISCPDVGFDLPTSKEPVLYVKAPVLGTAVSSAPFTQILALVLLYTATICVQTLSRTCSAPSTSLAPEDPV